MIQRHSATAQYCNISISARLQPHSAIYEHTSPALQYLHISTTTTPQRQTSATTFIFKHDYNPTSPALQYFCVSTTTTPER